MKEAAAEKQHQQRLQFQLHAEVGTLGQKLGPQFRVEIAVEETIEENIKVLAGVIDNAYPCQRCSLYGHIGMITTKQHKRRADLFNIFVKYATFGRAERSEEMTSNQVLPSLPFLTDACNLSHTYINALMRTHTHMHAPSQCCCCYNFCSLSLVLYTQFSKLCKDCKLINNKTVMKADIDIIFSRCRAETEVLEAFQPKKGSEYTTARMMYPQFLFGLLKVAEKRRSGFQEVYK
eukprot:1161786-Pelagomonas_calceolata.AAC.1